MNRAERGETRSQGPHASAIAVAMRFDTSMAAALSRCSDLP